MRKPAIPESRSPSLGAGLPILLLLFLTLVFAGGCGKSRPILSVYTWADYFNPELLKRFERENGCRVVIDTFESNEAMYAKLKAGAAGYDILTPTSYMVSVMFDQDMLLRLDRGRLPNISRVDPEFLKITIDKAMDHSVPYMLVNSGIAYLEGRVKDVRPTWNMFDRTDLKGRMTMFNDMRESIGAALKSLGYSINTVDERELREAEAVLLRWKKNLAKFDNEQYKFGLASGEFLLVHAWNGDVFQVRKENPDVRFFVPEEGTIISCDDLVIPKSARQPGLAHALINFLHDPRVAAENSNFIYYLCPNKDAYPLLNPEIRENPGIFLKPEIMARSEIIANIGAANALYIKLWDRVKSAN